MLRARLPGIVELRDGGFKLKANPRGGQVRLTLVMRWSITLLAFLSLVITMDLAVFYPIALHGMGRWVLPAICTAMGLGAWFALQPPAVSVAAGTISVGPWLGFDRIPRSDLVRIFRGQARFKYGWLPAYFLVTRDDRPKVTLMAENFTDDGMIALAERLDVPIDGDFTARVP